MSACLPFFRIAATLFCALLFLAGCDRGAKNGATGPLPEQRSKASEMVSGSLSPGSALSGNDSFQLSFLNLGCVLPSGQFKTFQFSANDAKINDGKSLEIAALIPLLSGGHYLQGSAVRHNFFVKPDITYADSNVLTVFDGETPFTCLLFGEGGYTNDLSNISGMEAMAGSWICAGDIGPIFFAQDGLYAQTSTKGNLVLSSPKQQPASMKMHLVSDIRADFWSPSVSTLNLDASALSTGRIVINGQECRRS